MDLRVVLDTDVNVNHPLAATDILRRKRPAASLRKPLWWLLHLVEPKTTQSAQWRAALVICTAECAACLLRPERQSCTTVLTKINQGAFDDQLGDAFVCLKVEFNLGREFVHSTIIHGAKWTCPGPRCRSRATVVRPGQQSFTGWL